MKSKLICLVLCLACFLTMLVGCGKEKCEAHVDADKNAACDTCGIPVYTVIEKVPSEEAIVEMVVSAIPEDATLADVRKLELEKKTLATFVKNEAMSQMTSDPVPFPNQTNPYLIYFVYREQTAGKDTTEETWNDESNPNGYLEDDKFADTYVVYAPLTAQSVLTYTTEAFSRDDISANRYDRASIQMLEGFFLKLTVTDWEKDEFSSWDYETDTFWYLANGTKIIDSTQIPEEESYQDPTNYYVGDYAYITYKGVIYAYDLESCALLTSAEEDAFVDRPEFDYMTDAYGYVFDNMAGFVYVYDLTKWIECVYAYEIPAANADVDVYPLNNGKLLVQESVLLPNAAVNYDYTDGTYKYDLVYTLVDVAAKTETEIEFGYYITSVDAPIEIDADAVKNVVYANLIKDKNLGKELVLLCDDDLKILAEENSLLPTFVSDLTLVADGVFLGEVVYGEGSSVYKLFNAEGAELATLPSSAEVYETYVYCAGKFYDFTMKLLLDLEAFEGTVAGYYEDYVLLNKDGDTYYWNSKLTAPVLVADATNLVDGEDAPNPVITQSVSRPTENYFIVTTTTVTSAEGEPDETTVVHNLYNAANVKILTSEFAITSIAPMECEDGSYWILMTADGSIYFSK